MCRTRAGKGFLGAAKGKWDLSNDRLTDHTWCEPIPEYRLDEGTWNIDTYHCTVTEGGVIVLWNGDGFLQMTLIRTE